jgi:hypothetical protein
MIILPENKLLRVKVQNLDTAAPIFVTVSARTWTFPARYADTLRSLLPSVGYASCGKDDRA